MGFGDVRVKPPGGTARTRQIVYKRVWEGLQASIIGRQGIGLCDGTARKFARLVA